MSKKEKSIELLNKAVSDELLAVNQYMYFHFRCDDYGYDLLSNLFKRTAIHEMLHVERLAERILFLKGEVEMTPSGSVEKIHCVKEMLKKAAEMETGSVDDYNNWANECGANADSVTKKMFEDLAAEEEKHWSARKRCTSTSTKRRSITSKNTGTITWRCNPSSVAKASLRKWRLPLPANSDASLISVAKRNPLLDSSSRF